MLLEITVNTTLLDYHVNFFLCKLLITRQPIQVLEVCNRINKALFVYAIKIDIK